MSNMPTLPNMADVDPTDPDGFLRAFLARYFTPGLVDSYIRTFVPAALGWALSWLALNFRWFDLPNEPSTTFSTSVTLGAIAGYYALARWAERRYPRLGRWLLALNLTRRAPVYVGPVAGPAVVEAAEVPASATRAAY